MDFESALNHYKKGNEIITFQGYKYIFKDIDTLVPKCGLVANRKDYTRWNERKQLYPNLNMNRFPAYAEALIHLNSIPKPKKKTTTKKTIKKKSA